MDSDRPSKKVNKSAGIIAKISPKHKDINSVVMNIDEPMAHWGGLRENLEANQMALPRKVSNQKSVLEMSHVFLDDFKLLLEM